MSSTEDPAITEMLAAAAHLEDALATDPRDTAAVYTVDHSQLPAQSTAQNGSDAQDQAPALTNPALAVACPACNSQPGALCTSHSGTRTRRHNVHRARTAALKATS
ncbi:hypothetical protein [Streptomyces sp. NRRL F-5065]|uniref:zinc finger domain-containing protein n=1 Tax=Streptomyces sp. NRRL F-5065 TaxID=1463855 RepID=UPI00131BAF9B|nr:hypothetical protein [Streptomyces sp. NRRL F-5065]